jgi:hypothetical protein
MPMDRAYENWYSTIGKQLEQSVLIPPQLRERESAASRHSAAGPKGVSGNRYPFFVARSSHRKVTVD